MHLPFVFQLLASFQWVVAGYILKEKAFWLPVLVVEYTKKQAVVKYNSLGTEVAKTNGLGSRFAVNECVFIQMPDGAVFDKKIKKKKKEKKNAIVVLQDSLFNGHTKSIIYF